MDILVTGGAGFIGGHLAQRFVRSGHDVVVFDNFDPYYDVGLKEHNVEAVEAAAESSDGSCTVVEGDVRDRDLTASLVAEADCVYHHAAQAGVRTDYSFRKYHEVNVDGTLNLLEAAEDADLERFVCASSSSVYGEPRYLPYDEDHPTTPVSAYGASKLAGERYAMVHARQRGVPAVALRYFTVYGPRMRPNMAVSNFVSRCINGDPPVVYGDGSIVRDFTYVDDVVDVNRALLTDDAADGEVLNVGSTGTITIQALAETVRDELAPDLEIEYTEGYDIDADATHANIDKANDLLGYEPSRTVREGVREFIAWYRENRDWYEPLVREG
ncbi:MAG: NAD-dependent epimerase/dehydratase family protein [Haloarculaceae archaeon]